MIWVYAIAERPELGVPQRHGLAEAPLLGIAAGDLLAVVTRHAEALGEPAPDALWAHEEVVEALMADRAVLPMRFGTTLADDEAVRGAVLSRHDELAAALDHVRGRVELGVRAVSTAAGAATTPEPVPATGRDYIRSRLADGRRAEALHAPLADVATDARRQRASQPGEILRASYLVERGDVGRFRAAVDDLSHAHPEVAVLCTGPWPAYSFVGAGA